MIATAHRRLTGNHLKVRQPRKVPLQFVNETETEPALAGQGTFYGLLRAIAFSRVAEGPAAT